MSSSSSFKGWSGLLFLWGKALLCLFARGAKLCFASSSFSRERGRGKAELCPTSDGSRLRRRRLAHRVEVADDRLGAGHHRVARILLPVEQPQLGRGVILVEVAARSRPA